MVASRASYLLFMSADSANASGILPVLIFYFLQKEFKFLHKLFLDNCSSTHVSSLSLSSLVVPWLGGWMVGLENVSFLFGFTSIRIFYPFL